jgi:hypothetical protein
MVIMLQSPRKIHHSETLMVAVIAILLAACSPGTETTNTPTDTATSPSIDTASSSSPQTGERGSTASAEVLGVKSISEINFKNTSKNSPNGYLDGINGSGATQIEVPNSTPITVRGWAILPNEGKPADKVIITSGDNNSLIAVVPVNVERPDVAKNFKNPDYKNSGWNITLNPSTLPTSKVVLKAWAYNSANKEATQLNSTREVTISN